MTRGIYGFRKGNVDKVTFCKGDSFLKGLGKEMVKFIKETPIETMNKIFNKIILVDLIQEATEEQIEDCKKFSNLEANVRSLNDFTCLLWKSIGSLKAYRDENLRYMIDAASEITNPHLCEYAYIINLDTNEFEIYTLMYKKIMEDRYNKTGKVDGCKLIKKYQLDNIPSNWIKECEQIIYNDIVSFK